jgi:hypothetical protein
MPTNLTPEERTLRGRLAAHAAHAKHGGTAMTTAARKAGPGHLEYYFDDVDPDRSLPEPERVKRAEQAKKAYYARLSFLSAKARRKDSEQAVA